MVDNNIFFSVIIPTRNRPQVFNEALNSVLNQDENSFEIIVVNDGSDELYLSDYLKQCDKKNITLLNLEQSLNGHGPSYSLNMGVNIAKGQYIAFLDDDDQWISSSHLSKSKEALKDIPADLYLSLQEAYKYNKLVDKSIWLSPLTDILKTDAGVVEVNINSLIKCHAFAHRNNLIISQSLYKDLNGHDENLRYEEDREFYLRAIEHAKKIIFSPKFISRHNIPIPKKNNNLSTSYSEIKKLLSQLYLFNSILTQSNNLDIIKYVELQKSYTLQHLTNAFYKEKNYTIASHYARQVALIKPNIKWLLFTIFISIKNSKK